VDTGRESVKGSKTVEEKREINLGSDDAHWVNRKNLEMELAEVQGEERTGDKGKGSEKKR